MHAELVRCWIRVIVATLLSSLLALHFAEHIWRRILQHPTSIQRALCSTPAQLVDLLTIDPGGYMCTLVETVRDAELTLLKKLGKAKGGPTGVQPQEAPRGLGLRRDDAS